MRRLVVVAGLWLTAGPVTDLSAQSGPACPLFPDPGRPPVLYPHGEDEQDPLDQARRWLDAGRPARALELTTGYDTAVARMYRLAALAELGSWNAFDPALGRGGWPAACDRLVDRLVIQRGVVDGSMRQAEAALARFSARAAGLSSYADLWRLMMAADVGDVTFGEAAWARLRSGSPTTVVVHEARQALARLYEAAGRSAEARAWHEALADRSRGAERAGHWLAAADQAARAGDVERERRLLRRVLEERPEAIAGRLEDSVWRQRLGVDPARAAGILLAAGRSAAAATIAGRAVESATTPEATRRALLARARARAAGGDQDGAERDYAAIADGWPVTDEGREAAYERARLVLRSGEAVAGRLALLRFADDHPRHERADDALYLAADAFQDDRAGDPSYADRAIAAFDRLVAGWPRSFFADRAYMRAAHLSFALGRNEDAERRYRAYPGDESRREARYWHARAIEAMGNRAAAIAQYRAIAGGDDYYAARARGRLDVGSADPFMLDGYAPAPDPVIAAVAETVREPAFARARVLVSIGERRYARAELERDLALKRRDRDALRRWGPAAEAFGFPDLALRAGTWLGVAGERLAHPVGFAPWIDEEARHHDVDAVVLLALIRQESLFDAGAVSPAAAHGLMQILLPTGSAMATAAGWESFDASILHRPVANLHFGTLYFARQAERFGDFLPATLAAYNGGPDNVERWLRFPEREQDPELWIERIPFRETRNYVKRVIEQMLTYRRVHGSPFEAP